MGHSSVPADQEPFATILGLEDGTPCFVDEGALHHPIPTTLPLLAEIPMVGMQRCECCSYRGGIHGRMAVRFSVTCQDPILEVPTLGKTVPSDKTSHRSDPRGTHPSEQGSPEHQWNTKEGTVKSLTAQHSGYTQQGPRHTGAAGPECDRFTQCTQDPPAGDEKITTSFTRETQSKQRPSCPFLSLAL